MTDIAYCPYCDHKHTDLWEYNMSDGDMIEVECESCPNKFALFCSVDVSYETEKIEE